MRSAGIRTVKFQLPPSHEGEHSWQLPVPSDCIFQLPPSHEGELGAKYGNTCLLYTSFRASFETGGVLIPAEGDAALLVGPETLERARSSSPLPRTLKMLGMRESSAPRYEDPSADTFEAVLGELQKQQPLKKVGIAGWRFIPMDLYREIEAALKSVSPQAEIVPADEAVDRVRAQKSPAETLLIRQAARIAKQTLEHVISLSLIHI